MAATSFQFADRGTVVRFSLEGDALTLARRGKETTVAVSHRGVLRNVLWNESVPPQVEAALQERLSLSLAPQLLAFESPSLLAEDVGWAGLFVALVFVLAMLYSLLTLWRRIPAPPITMPGSPYR